MKNKELKHIGYRMIGTERWEVLVGGDSWTYKADRKARRIIVADRPEVVRDSIVDHAVRELQAEFVERTYPSNQPQATSKCSYPADALGILVEMVDGPLKTKDGRRFIGQIKSDTLVIIDRTAPLHQRQHSAAFARQRIAERLPEGEMEAFAADLADVARKIGPMFIPPAMPFDGWTFERDRKTKLWHCPLCKSKAYKTASGMWDHARRIHDLDCLNGRWRPSALHRAEGLELVKEWERKMRKGGGQ